ncbi:MAG: hypothetical protein J1E80_02325 [Desulfovibrionaceae bacterium]|nr:hypothetical protein [Desulfovibrionaceae bacterium]
MRSGISFSAFCLAVLFMTGCSGLNIPNPFATTSDVNDVYMSQFPDIPIPADMKSVPKNSLVTATQDGTRVGLESFEGRVEAASLSNAMIHNLSRQGWSLRGSVTGKRTMQVHEKDTRYVVLYLYEQTMTTAMEVWVLNRLTEGGFGGFGLPSGVPGSFSSSPASSATEVWEGGFTSQPLNQ